MAAARSTVSSSTTTTSSTTGTGHGTWIHGGCFHHGELLFDSTSGLANAPHHQGKGEGGGTSERKKKISKNTREAQTMPLAATRPSRPPHSRVTTSGRAAVGACAGHVGVPAEAARYHDHAVGAGQCCSAVVQAVAAPADAVWSVVRRFDRPQEYKRFIKSCRLVDGDGGAVGSVREVCVVSGLPAVTSRERLEVLDDVRRVISFRIVGGEHRLSNYRSVTSVQEAASAAGSFTKVVESYVVDVPPGNTTDETRMFVDTIVRCNLQSLARTVEQLAIAVPRHN